MNIKLDIDATPEELRRFFGLPDVHPLQEELMQKVREKMVAGIDGFDPMTLMKPFLPEHLQSLEALQRQFWQGLVKQPGAGAASSGGKDAKDSNKK